MCCEANVKTALVRAGELLGVLANADMLDKDYLAPKLKEARELSLLIEGMATNFAEDEEDEEDDDEEDEEDDDDFDDYDSWVEYDDYDDDDDDWDYDDTDLEDEEDDYYED